MNANLMTGKIEMSKTEAKAAGKINSEKFNELHTLRTMYPTFEIVIKAPSMKTTSRENYKGLTYEYMEKYIATHDDDKKSIRAEYEMMRGTSEEAKEALAESYSYYEMKIWFLNKFPAIAEFHKKREEALSGKAA
jgi:hypothetical protein